MAEDKKNELPFNPGDIPIEPPFQLTPKEAEEAEGILKDLFSIEDPKAMAAAAMGLARKVEREASKREFYIYWIHATPGGHCVNKGITRDKQDGENQLRKFKVSWPDAVITWRGPMDYITGRRMLEQGVN